MLVFVGLGNPGERYQRTRHNLGFRVVDQVAEKHHVLLKKGCGPYRVGHAEIGSQPVLLAQPLTYMNKSGIAVFDLMARYAVPLSRLVVVCDDFNLPRGRLRIRSKGSDGGHNGLESVIRYTHSESFARLRMGIGPVEQHNVVQFVLSPFSADEEPIAEYMVGQAVSALVEIAENSLEQAITIYNR